MRALKLLATIAITVVIQACSTSKAVVSHNIDLSKYSYVVFGKETSGDRELDDIIMTVQNEIAATKLAVVSAQDGLAKIAIGEFVLSPNIHVSTEKWDGGHTYIRPKHSPSGNPEETEKSLWRKIYPA